MIALLIFLLGNPVGFRFVFLVIIIIKIIDAVVVIVVNGFCASSLSVCYVNICVF